MRESSSSSRSSKEEEEYIYIVWETHSNLAALSASHRISFECQFYEISEKETEADRIEKAKKKGD